MPLEFETDNFPFVQAKHFIKVTQRRRVRLVVMHSMESFEKGTTAEDCAEDFRTTERPASAHLCIDNNSIVQSVLDNNIPAAAPGANRDGIHLELAGFAKQTKDEWLDDYGKALLENAAEAAGQYCLKYDIPARRLSNEELAAGEAKGFVSHGQVSEVFKKSSHTDPGPGFPWEFFLGRVEDHRVKRLAKLTGGQAVATGGGV
jgi:N-acetyl-anhydromuramyl-L-alanine amidase AmpD